MGRKDKQEDRGYMSMSEAGGGDGGGNTHQPRASGVIKRLVMDKGFGFIRDPQGAEHFFHRSGCEGVEFEDLREGDAVTFRPGKGPKGPRAESVQAVKSQQAT